MTKIKKKKIDSISFPEIKGKNKKDLKDAITVFNYALDSVNKFYKIYQIDRAKSIGSSTNQEQDLLRAMLVFSCSGLDAVLKQLIKNTLPIIIQKDLGAQKEFQKFVDRRLKKVNNNEKDKIYIDTELLSQVLTHRNPRYFLINHLTKSLTDDSLQNRDQLLKVASYFAITSEQVLKEPSVTKEAFDARNNIIHEMDADFGSVTGKKNRCQRSKLTVVKFCKNILLIGKNFIEVVSDKLD